MTEIYAESERLNYYKPSEEDFDAMRNLIIDELPSANKKDPFTLEQIDSAVNRTRKHWEDHGYGTCVAKLKSTGEIVGFGGPKHVSFQDEQVIDIGAIAKKEYQSQGYAVEAFPVFIKIVFTKLKKDKIATAIHPNNKPVVHLVEKFGYKYIKDIDYELDGVKYTDQRYYELSREEYEKGDR